MPVRTGSCCAGLIGLSITGGSIAWVVAEYVTPQSASSASDEIRAQGDSLKLCNGQARAHAPQKAISRRAPNIGLVPFRKDHYASALTIAVAMGRYRN